MVFKRCISPTEPLALTPSRPVKNAATKSGRSSTVGAVTPNKTFRIRGNVGFVTYDRNCVSSFGSLALNLSLSGSPITTSLTNGIPKRDTCVQAPPLTAGCLKLGVGSNTRTCGKLAVVHPPIIPFSFPPVKQEIGTSSAIVVIFLSFIVFFSPSTSPRGLVFTKSNTSPKLTAKDSFL